jgi:glycosyltransferase involved in cell wall biosynthesis
MNPRISVVIPTFNRAAFIERCVQSVLDQTFKDFEIIVVDDGSVDNSKEILAKYLDLACFTYHCQSNRGRSFARNEGVRHSVGNWIMYLDSDDFLDPKALQTLFDLSNCGGQTEIAFGNFLFMNADGKTFPISGSFQEELLDKNLFFEMLGGHLCLTKTGTFLIKRELVEKMSGFKTQFEPSEDLDFAIRSLIDSKVSYTNEVVLFVNRHDENTDEISLQHAMIKICEAQLIDISENKLSLPKDDASRMKALLLWIIANNYYALNINSSARLFYLRFILHSPENIGDVFLIKQIFSTLIPKNLREKIKKVVNPKYLRFSSSFAKY